MEDRGSNEIEQRIEDEGKRISRGGHRISQGVRVDITRRGRGGAGGAGVQKPVKTIEDVRNRNTAWKTFNLQFDHYKHTNFCNRLENALIDLQ